MDNCLIKILVIFATPLFLNICADSNRICEGVVYTAIGLRVLCIRFACISMHTVSILSHEVNGTLFVPQGSSIHTTCTTNLLSLTLFWKLQSTDILTETRYSADFEQRFRDLGYYQLRENDNNILLHINNTNLNETNITCAGEEFGIGISTLYRRTLLTYGRCHKLHIFAESLPAIVSQMQTKRLSCWNQIPQTGQVEYWYPGVLLLHWE